MAKKKTKKQSRKKKVEEAPQGPGFWPQAGAIILMIAAFFLLLGSFGTGGPLPLGMFEGAYWALGWGAYLAPVALACFGFWKFTHEEKRIPLGKFVGMLLTLALTAAWLHVAFVQEDITGSFTAGNGGAAGSLIGNIALNALDKIPASILFFVLAVLMLFMTFGISLDVIKNFFEMFRRSESEDTDLAELKSRASDTGFKLEAGVPIENGNSRERHRSTFKNAAAKLTAAEDHAALTAASDPNWTFPSIDLLNQKQDKADAGDVEGRADIIKETFSNFNIAVDMEGANIGPRVTQYTLKPASGVKLSKLANHGDDLAYSLAAQSIRIEAPIPGMQAVGIEVPNKKSATVRISSLLQSSEWGKLDSPLGFAIGKNIAGKPVVGDLAKMPHLLVAGQTGSGKSVMINTILSSLLYRNSPSDLKLIMVDPKFVELGTYNEIPHLLTPVITEPEKCISALKWAVAEMERRLKAMAEVNTSNIAEYNDVKQEEGMPYIVIVIDELADLMMMAARDVEALIVRIAQKARAAGIHLILATQRPSVNVITGLIKANVPARIAFTVASQVDSRTIIDQMGAEKLLGMGDMLFYTTDMSKPTRVQGALIEKGEVVKVTKFIKDQREPDYNDEVVSQPVQIGKGGVVVDMGSGDDMDDPMYKEAVRAVIDGRKASTSLLQRRLRIGYGKAARFMETMEEQGIISSADGNRPREVLVSSMDEVFGGGGVATDDVLDENFPDEA